MLALRSRRVRPRHESACTSARPSPGGGHLDHEEDPAWRRPIITGLAHRTDEAKITIAGVQNRPGVAAQIFTALADRDVNVDTIIQNRRAEAPTCRSRCRSTSCAWRSTRWSASAATWATVSSTSDDQIGKVTLVGAGMKSEPGIAAKMFRVLAEQGINLQMIDTSTIRITVVIDRREVERAVRALHDAFDLAGEAARRADV